MTAGVNVATTFPFFTNWAVSSTISWNCSADNCWIGIKYRLVIAPQTFSLNSYWLPLEMTADHASPNCADLNTISLLAISVRAQQTLLEHVNMLLQLRQEKKAYRCTWKGKCRSRVHLCSVQCWDLDTSLNEVEMMRKCLKHKRGPPKPWPGLIKFFVSTVPINGSAEYIIP